MLRFLVLTWLVAVPIQNRLRRVSIALLAIALVMLLCGFTLLEPRLKGVLFVIYWLACFAVAGLAIIAALLDLLIIRRDARRAQSELIRRSFEDLLDK